MEINETIVENIDKLCKERYISRVVLQNDLGWAKNSIFRWKTNMPSIDKVCKVADYFGVSVDYLCGMSEESPTTAAGIISALKSLGMDITQLDKLTAEDAKIMAMILKKQLK